MITSFDQLDLSKRYTYADYLTWQFDDMVELIHGKIFKMSPAPGVRHQQVAGNLHGLIWAYLRKDPSQVFSAPFDVRLPLPPQKKQPDKIDSVVQPDICVICDPTKLDNQGCNGAPDLIIEILSPATSKKDLTEKFEIYQHAGVREYWIVHPHENTLLIYLLEDHQYQLLRQTPFTKGEKVSVAVFPDLLIDLEEVFG